MPANPVPALPFESLPGGSAAAASLGFATAEDLHPLMAGSDDGWLGAAAGAVVGLS